MLHPNPVYLHTTQTYYVMKTKLIHMNRIVKIAFWFEAMASQIAGFALAFLSQIYPFIAVTTLLVFVDQFTGRAAARKRGETMTSRGMLRTVEKLMLYLAALITAEAVYFVFLKEKLPSFHITYGVAAQIAFTELKSNFENIGTVTGTTINLTELIRAFKK
mgnify:CR=1 FL=1